MILFADDILREKVIIDTKTRNNSFLKMAVTLRKLGVTNNKFFLALYQKELQGVDPHNLPKANRLELAHRVAFECKINAWYYYRECVRIKQAGDVYTPFLLNRANLALVWCYFNSIDSFLTIPRQTGKTISSMALLSWPMFIGSMGSAYGMFAKGPKLVHENVSRIKAIRDGLPEYLVFNDPKDAKNKEDVTYKSMGNKLKSFIGQSDKGLAADQGRGESFVSEYWDEIAWYRNVGISYAPARAATNAASEQARDIGIPAANIHTTTAGKLSDPRGQFAHKLKSKALPFTEKLFDAKDRADLEELLQAGSSNGMIYITYSYLQLGKTKEWFNFVTRGLDREEIELDYLNNWSMGTTAGVLKEETLKTLRSTQVEPVYVSRLNNLLFRWYQPANLIEGSYYKNKTLIIATDTSDNVGNDYTTIVIMDPANMSVLGTCRCNSINLVYVARCLVELLQKFTRSIFIPERNKNGATVVDIMLDEMRGRNMDPIRRIFNKFIQNFNDKTPEFHTIDLDGPMRKHLGFTTTGGANSSRAKLYGTVLNLAMEKNATKVFDSILIDELCALTMKNGRVDHPDGQHDDMVIAYLLACYVVYFGKNLDMYAIDASQILSEVDEFDNSATTPALKRQIQESRERIERLEDLMLNTNNTMLRTSYERELIRLKSKVPDDKLSEDIVSVVQAKRDRTNKQQAAPDFNSVMCTLQALNNGGTDEYNGFAA